MGVDLYEQPSPCTPAVTPPTCARSRRGSRPSARRSAMCPLQVAAQYYLLGACHLSGDYRGTEDLCRKLMQSLQGDRTREQFGVAAFPAVLSRCLLGAHPRRARRVRRRRHSRTRSHPDGGSARSSVQPHLRMSVSRVSPQPQGGAEPGRPPARTRGRSLPRVEHHVFTPIATASLGHVYAWSGRIGEGSPACSRP